MHFACANPQANAELLHAMTFGSQAILRFSLSKFLVHQISESVPQQCSQEQPQ